MRSLILNLLVLSSCLVIHVCANTKYVKVLPSDAKVLKPRARTPFPKDFAKKYWISGTFFNKKNFEGLPMSFYISGSKCINFPEHKSLSSVKPFGCVMLYNAKNCQGTYAVVADEMSSLSSVGIQDMIGSMKSCPPVDDSWNKSAVQSYQSSPSSSSSTTTISSIIPILNTDVASYKTIDIALVRS